MDSSTEELTLKCLQRVQIISQDAESCSESDLPRVLLLLKQLLDSNSLDSKGVRKLKEYIWQKDLIHIIIEVLRQDFSHVSGQWSTAVKLAHILVTVCAGFNPKVPKKGASHTLQQLSEHVNEYYEILLPTATDSLLMLANNLLEQEADSTGTTSQPESLEHFQVIMDSVLWFCSSHTSCIQRVLQSPYFLQVLITDHTRHCHIVLTTLEMLVKADSSSMLVIPSSVLNSILDELVYKLSGNDETSAFLSLKLAATLVNLNPNLLDILVSRYTGLYAFVSKWKSRVQDPLVLHLCSELDARTIVEREEERQNNAAVVIQATWRGYTSRKRIRNMHKGIRKFQRIYRKKKAEKMQRKAAEMDLKNTKEAKMLELKRSRLKFQESQLSMIEQLPASDVKPFVKQQESHAATVLQSWWRGRSAHSKYKQIRKEAHLSACATIIQRAVRQHLRKKTLGAESNIITPLSHMDEREREQLQQEIAQHRETHPMSYRTEAQAKELHVQVQDLLGQFYLSRTQTQRKNDERRNFLVTQLSRDSDLLLNAPLLKDLASDSTASVIASYSSGSVSIAKMAQVAHKEELKASDTPWWKRPALDMEEVNL